MATLGSIRRHWQYLAKKLGIRWRCRALISNGELHLATLGKKICRSMKYVHLSHREFFCLKTGFSNAVSLKLSLIWGGVGIG